MHTFADSHAFRYAGSVFSLCLVLTGCSSFSGSQIHSSPKGSVQLQDVADWSFEASHPIIIDHMTMLKVIKGVWADEAMPGSSNKMPASGSKPMRAFSDEDAEFLAPLLAQGLSQAKPEQIVGFTVSSSAGSGADPTVGTLYVQGGAIYLTIGAPHGKRVSAFAPSTAARLEKAPSFAAARTPGTMSIVIDYRALAKSPMPSAVVMAIASKQPAIPSIHAKATETQAVPARPHSVSLATATESASGSPELSTDEILNKKLDELRQAREINAQKESEISMLRKEAEWMKQELRERSAELKILRASKVSSQLAPKKKTAEARPFP